MGPTITSFAPTRWRTTSTFTSTRGGRRAVLAEGEQEVPSGVWQELGVEVRGNSFRGFLNGRQVVEASDATFAAGGVGLWTKADSVTCFDDVEVRAL